MNLLSALKFNFAAMALSLVAASLAETPNNGILRGSSSRKQVDERTLVGAPFSVGRKSGRRLGKGTRKWPKESQGSNPTMGPSAFPSSAPDLNTEKPTTARPSAFEFDTAFPTYWPDTTKPTTAQPSVLMVDAAFPTYAPTIHGSVGTAPPSPPLAIDTAYPTTFGPTTTFCQTYDPSPRSCTSDERQFIFSITTDKWSGETAFFLRHHDDCILASWSEFYSSHANYTLTYCLPIGRNYVVELTDSYGDGICCSWGMGSYSLDVNGSRLFDSNGTDSFGRGVRHTIRVEEMGSILVDTEIEV